jgi:hypothetical protein
MGGQVDVRVPAVVVDFLELFDHAEVAVVDQGYRDRDTLDRGGGQFLVGHLEAAVAVDRPHLPVGCSKLGTERRRAPHNPSCRDRPN